MTAPQPDEHSPATSRDVADTAKTGARRIAVIAAIAITVLIVVAAVVYGLVFVILAPMM